MASDPSFARARELYLAHDGSRFYMSRNGVEHEYLSYGVPLEVEEQWRRELVAEKIAKLSQPGNWTTMNYLCHHNDTGYLNEAVTAEPLGEPWQRVSYLELLLEYIERCACFYRSTYSGMRSTPRSSGSSSSTSPALRSKLSYAGAFANSSMMPS
jgi:hypothetical protein